MKEKKFLVPDIRNKLSPITTLISLLETNGVEYDRYIKQALKQSKISINYLADREVYKDED